MSRTFSNKVRGEQSRNHRRKIFVGAEGKNKSEINYFRSLALDRGWGFKPTNQASTDPENLAKKLVQLLKDAKVCEGDLAFCLVDHDATTIKNEQIVQAENVLKQGPQEVSPMLIVSNPSFETWVLYHFQKVTKAYDNKTLLKDVKKCVGLGNYEKNMDNLYDIISSQTGVAIENAKYAERIHIRDGKKIHTSDFNSSTEIYKIFELIDVS